MRRRLAPDERQSEILAASIKVFESTPYEQVSVGMIAKAAGMSSGLLYHYYPSKQALFKAAYTHLSQSLVQACLGAGTHTEPWPFIQGCLDAYVQYAQAHPAATRMILMPGANGDVELAGFNSELNDQLVQLLQAVMQVPSTDTLTLAGLRAWVAFVDSGVLALLSGQATDAVGFKKMALKVLKTVMTASEA